jgi:hypothetical protein
VTDAPAPGTTVPEELEGGFSRRTLGWITGVAVTSLALAILLIAFGDDLEARRPNPHANTFSRSAVGHRALVEFLREMGLGVVSRQSPGAGGTGPARPLVLAEPDTGGPSGDQMPRIESLRADAVRRQAALVLVLPKWRGAPRKDKPEWIDKARLLPDQVVLRVLAALGDSALKGAALDRAGTGGLRCSAAWTSTAFRIETSPPQLLRLMPGFEPVVRCGGGLLVARRKLGEGPEVYVVSDPDVLNNHGLGLGDNAALVYGLLAVRLRAAGVVFDETIHGFNRIPGLMAELRSFPLVLAVLQGLVLAGMLVWAGVGRFGKPLPVTHGAEAGKEILIDNTARLLAGGGYAADSLARYFRQVTRAVAASFFLPPDLPEPEMLARLQRIADGRRVAVDLAAIERRIQALPEGPRAAERAARIAKSLYDWRLEMTNGTRQGS